MLTDADRAALIAATEAARQRMADHERDSCLAVECADDPEHICTILDRLLALYAMRVIRPWRKAR